MFKNEPAIVVGVVQAILMVAIAFGAPITDDQKVAILGAAGAIAVLIGAFVVRQNVVPVAKT